jgi:hypothetical protein
MKVWHRWMTPEYASHLARPVLARMAFRCALRDGPGNLLGLGRSQQHRISTSRL